MVYICKPLPALSLRCFNIFLLAGVLLLSACAQVVAPSGGPADVKPPELVSSDPAFLSKNFSGNRMKIRFNEYIKLNDASSQLIISPPFKNPPSLKTRGKILDVSWEDTLRKNTTYVFQFGKAVADITEGNAATSLRMVFSTGSFIDTGMVWGNVLQANNKQACKDFTVMLYDSLAADRDSFVSKSLPSYFGRSAEDGSFSISNVRSGTYRVAALKDGNNNYLYDDASETFAFADQPVLVRGDSARVALDAFTAVPIKQYLKKHDFTTPQLFRFVMNKPMASFEIRQTGCADMDAYGYREFTPGADSARVWFSDSLHCDSVHLLLVCDGVVTDTLHESLKKMSMKNRGKGKAVMPSKVIKGTFLLSSEKSVGPGEGLRMQFPVPAIRQLPGKAWLGLGKDSIPAIFVPADSTGYGWKLEAKLLADTFYRLHALPGAFLMRNGKTSDTLKTTFKLMNTEETGSIVLQVQHTSPHPVLCMLMDGTGKIIRKNTLKNREETLGYDLLLPGKYKLEAIEDKNANGRWDTGDFFKNLQPETVWKFGEEIEVRASWEIEKRWEIK